MLLYVLVILLLLMSWLILFTGVYMYSRRHANHYLLERFFPGHPPIYCVNSFDSFLDVSRSEFSVLIDAEPHRIDHYKHFDLVITSKKEKLPPNTPTIYLSMAQLHFIDHPCIQKYLDHPVTSPMRDRPYFCIFAFSNCDEEYEGVQYRNAFFTHIQKQLGDRVLNIGRCMDGTPDGGTHSDNMMRFQNVRFVIAIENTPMKGYITEKITNPLIGGAIPIYYGAPDVTNMINPKRFIHLRDYANWDEAIDYILKVDASPKLFEAITSQPIFVSQETFMEPITGGHFYRELATKVPLEFARCIRPQDFHRRVKLKESNPISL